MFLERQAACFFEPIVPPFRSCATQFTVPVRLPTCIRVASSTAKAPLMRSPAPSQAVLSALQVSRLI